MFDPFGGDDSLGAWLFEQQLLEAEEERKKQREEEHKINRPHTSSTHDYLMDCARAREAAAQDEIRKNLIDSCSRIDESKIVTENIHNVYELAASLETFKQINERMELDTALWLKEVGLIPIQNLDKHLARIEGFRRGALNLAKASRDRGDYDLATACLEVVGFAEEKLSLFIKVKENTVRKAWPRLFR
jgi:hypothetical protein